MMEARVLNRLAGCCRRRVVEIPGSGSAKYPVDREVSIRLVIDVGGIDTAGC